MYVYKYVCNIYVCACVCVRARARICRHRCDSKTDGQCIRGIIQVFIISVWHLSLFEGVNKALDVMSLQRIVKPRSLVSDWDDHLVRICHLEELSILIFLLI